MIATACSPVVAASNSSASGPGNGLKVSPVRSELTVNPGQTVTLDVYVQNVTSQAATFQALINDFVASGDESGSPALILNSNKSAPSHGLKQFIQPVSNFSLKPGQQKDVKVVISIPKNAAGGGYFGAVRFAPASTAALSTSGASLSASVASLILVRVPGNIVDQMSIASFDARSGNNAHGIFTSNKNISAVVRFQNEGNVQEQPFGTIVVKDMHGHKIASYAVNNVKPAGNVLPNSIRKFSVPLDKISSFGRYTLEGNFGYTSTGKLLTATATFYVIPIPLIVAAIILVVIILVAIFEIPRLIRRYNKRILRRAGRR